MADSYSSSVSPAAVLHHHLRRDPTRRGRSTPPRGASSPDAPNPRATVHEATRRSTCQDLDPTGRPTRSHTRLGMTPLPAASAGTTLMGRGTSNVLSYRYATSPESGHTGYSTTKVAGQQGYERSDGALTLRVPFQCGWSRLQGIRTATYQRLRWSGPVWSPPPESNRRPHPYHGTTRNRCADRRLRRSRPTVGAKVNGSLSTKLCALRRPARSEALNASSSGWPVAAHSPNNRARAAETRFPLRS